MTGERERLLVVDDDDALRNLLARYLTENGYEVAGVADGVAMHRYLIRHPVDLILLDVMLPGVDGIALARELRQHGSPPVIMISARGEEIDRIVGLEVGADDYLAKPFHHRELLARIRAVLRRGRGAQGTRPAASSFGPYRLDIDARRVTRGGEEVALTGGEFALLRVLVEHPHQVLSRDRLVDLLKGYERAPLDRMIDVRITRLRRKIEPDPAHPVYIRTVWGEGYLFAPDAGER
jgi:DNA-binding response OmpR family regulator